MTNEKEFFDIDELHREESDKSLFEEIETFARSSNCNLDQLVIDWTVKSIEKKEGKDVKR